MPHPPVPDPLGNAMPWPGPGKATLRFADPGAASPLQAALAAGGAAAWHTDLQTRERWWSPEMFRIHGLGAGEAPQMITDAGIFIADDLKTIAIEATAAGRTA